MKIDPMVYRFPNLPPVPISGTMFSKKKDLCKIPDGCRAVQVMIRFQTAYIILKPVKDTGCYEQFDWVDSNGRALYDEHLGLYLLPKGGRVIAWENVDQKRSTQDTVVFDELITAMRLRQAGVMAAAENLSNTEETV